MNKIALLTIAIIMAGCTRVITVDKPVYISSKDSSEKITDRRYTERDVKLAADSAKADFQIKCDSLGNAYLSAIDQLQGERVRQDVTITQLEGYLALQVKSTDSAKQKVIESNAADTVYRYQYKDIPVEVKVEIPVNHLTGWQWFQVWWGRIVTIAVAIYVVILILKKKAGGAASIVDKIKTIINKIKTKCQS